MDRLLISSTNTDQYVPTNRTTATPVPSTMRLRGQRLIKLGEVVLQVKGIMEVDIAGIYRQ